VLETVKRATTNIETFIMANPRFYASSIASALLLCVPVVAQTAPTEEKDIPTCVVVLSPEWHARVSNCTIVEGKDTIAVLRFSGQLDPHFLSRRLIP
jgi:hypothetical protein